MVVMTSDLFRAQQTAHAFADIWDCQSPVTNDCVNAASASGKA